MPLKGLDRVSRWAVCGSSPFDRSQHLARQVLCGLGLGVRKEKERDGGVLWVLDYCPFCQKADGATHVEVRYDGTLCFGCKHHSCCWPDSRRYGWVDLRARYEAVGGEDYCPPPRREGVNERE